MSLDNALNAAESSVQADLRPVRTPASVESPEVRPLPAPAEPAPPSDEVRVSEGYLERLLSQRADEVLDRFHGRLEGTHASLQRAGATGI